jgi:two-component system, sensor histidine kinase and response regulator
MSPADKVNILLVDDQPQKLLSYEAALSGLGENLINANSGREALLILLKHDIAVILLDVNMPVLDGFETAALIRHHPRFENIPIIFVTGVNTTDMDRLKGYELGAVDYVYVPVIPEILRAKVAVFAELFRKTRELVALNLQLEQRVSERTADLEALNLDLERRVRERTAQLEEANRELEAFSYSVSHDLRAPLRRMDGFSKALLEDCGDRLNEQGHDYLRRIRAAAQNMGELIDVLLGMSHLSRVGMRREEVNLSEIARTVARELQEREPERRVEFLIDEERVGIGDPQLLRVVLENLLNNAWKFTSKHPSARIEFGTVEQNGKMVYFVRDNGVGFDMAYADKLFGAFQRLHPMSEFPGFGIGLATVQHIISRHGGRVWAEGAVDKGAVFLFTL